MEQLKLRCECINMIDRGNILFLLRSKIDELNHTIEETNKETQKTSRLEEIIKLRGNMPELMAMRDSLNGTRSRILDTPICE